MKGGSHRSRSTATTTLLAPACLSAGRRARSGAGGQNVIDEEHGLSLQANVWPGMKLSAQGFDPLGHAQPGQPVGGLDSP